MSHISVLRTKMQDQEALVKALKDVGSHAEVRQSGGRRQGGQEEIVVRKLVASAVFQRDAQGFFYARVGDLGRMAFGGEWLARVQQRYAYHVTRARLEEQGFSIVSEESEQGQVHLVLRRVA